MWVRLKCIRPSPIKLLPGPHAPISRIIDSFKVVLSESLYPATELFLLIYQKITFSAVAFSSSARLDEALATELAYAAYAPAIQESF